MAPWEPTTDELRDINGDWASSGAQDASSKYICEWRNGPAALWYEMLGVNEDGTNLDYGFKIKEVRSEICDIGNTWPQQMTCQYSWVDQIPNTDICVVKKCHKFVKQAGLI